MPRARGCPYAPLLLLARANCGAGQYAVALDQAGRAVELLHSAGSAAESQDESGSGKKGGSESESEGGSGDRGEEKAGDVGGVTCISIAEATVAALQVNLRDVSFRLRNVSF